MKFTVLVITYHAHWEKLRRTLSSILKQSLKEFEIVIADDGSGDFPKQQVQDFFDEKAFLRYRLVLNRENQGTVRNLLSGLAVSEGRYVKFISAGDLLYKEDTLQQIYDFMESKQSLACHGLLQGYCFSQGALKKIEFCHPFDLEAYRRGDKDRITKNLVLYSDNVCGAAITYERNFAIEYMNKIKDEVTYMEDIFQVLAALEGRPVDFLDAYVVWYEVGEGISTKKKSSFEERMRQDVKQFYDKLYQNFSANVYVKKRHRLEWVYRIKNLYLRTLLRFFVNPDALRYFINAKRQQFAGVHRLEQSPKGFLDRGDFE